MPEMQLVTANLAGKVRHDRMQGRDYIVAPMVMLTEGVHVGSLGAKLYPEKEISKAAATWNHKPVVIYHPQRNGEYISACEPDVLTARSVGMVLNCKWDKSAKKLRAEAWMEASRVSAIDDRVLSALQKDSTMEVSTGLYSDDKPEPGEWEGEKYDLIAMNHRPDHLAILPDQVGACSREDGAGLLVVNVSDDQVESVEKAIVANNAEAKVVEIHEDFAVLSSLDKLYVQAYNTADGKIHLDGEPVEVNRLYQTTDGTVLGANNKESDMDKEKIVDGLIANKATQYDKADKEWLMTLNEDQLKKMEPATEATPGGDGDGDDKNKNKDGEGDDSGKTPEVNSDGSPKVLKDPEQGKQTTNQAPTVEEYIANAPAEMQGALTAMMQSHDAEKHRLISTITANKDNQFTEDYLKTLGVETLKGIAALAKPAAQTANFSGAGGAPPVISANNVPEQTALVAPTCNFKKK